MEKMYVKAIIGGLLKLRNGGLNDFESGATKKKIGTALTGLKKVNEPLYDYYLEQYKAALGNLK